MTTIPNTTVSNKADGLWLNISSGGKHASINIDNLESDSPHGPLVRAVLHAWLRDLAVHVLNQQT